jgi:hypothetical protein
MPALAGQIMTATVWGREDRLNGWSPIPEILTLPAEMMPIRYLANLTKGRLILWCYFIWYLVVLVRYFDGSPRLWLTSLGLSLIIGIALYISTTASGSGEVKLGRWQTIRLFMMPFCVSSFSALVKGKGFLLIFSPNPNEIFIAIGICALLCGLVAGLKTRKRFGEKP